MSWTYSGDPSLTSLDQVRFLITDTDGTDQLVSNEEALWAITEEKNNYSAAAALCHQIASQFARKATSKSVDGLSLTYAERSREFRERAINLNARSTRKSAPTPYAGGISKADVDTVDSDTDRVVGFADRPDMWVNPGTGDTDDLANRRDWE